MFSMSRRAVVIQTLQDRLTRSMSRVSACPVEVRDANLEGNLVIKSRSGRNDNTRTYRYLSPQISIASDNPNVGKVMQVLPAVQNLLLYDHASLLLTRRVWVARRT